MQQIVLSNTNITIGWFYTGWETIRISKDGRWVKAVPRAAAAYGRQLIKWDEFSTNTRRRVVSFLIKLSNISNTYSCIQFRYAHSKMLFTSLNFLWYFFCDSVKYYKHFLQFWCYRWRLDFSVSHSLSNMSILFGSNFR